MEAQEELQEELKTVNQSLIFLVLIVFSVLLSLWGVLIQRRQLECTIAGNTDAVEALPPVFPIRHAAGSIIVGALGFFLCLALRTWHEATQEDDPAARRSACTNLWASLFVFLAALLRLDDLHSAENCRSDEAREDGGTV